MSHTPGPWVNHYRAVMTEAENWSIAVCTDQGGEKRNEANARLIAAAPELLHAAEIAEQLVEKFARKSLGLEVIRAAIAKAEGRA